MCLLSIYLVLSSLFHAPFPHFLKGRNKEVGKGSQERKCRGAMNEMKGLVINIKKVKNRLEFLPLQQFRVPK